jgi:hypothetical protein
VKNRQRLGPMRRSHLQPCPMRNDPHRERELERSAHPGDRPPAPRGRTKGHTYPRLPAGAASIKLLHFLASPLALKGFSGRECLEAKLCCPPGKVNARLVSLADTTWRWDWSANCQNRTRSHVRRNASLGEMIAQPRDRIANLFRESRIDILDIGQKAAAYIFDLF